MREVHVAIRLVHQLTHEIFHVTAHVTGLAEFRRVRLYERHFDQVSDVFDEIGFPDAGRSHEDHVLFRVLGLLDPGRIFFLELPQIIDVVVVIANRDRQDLLRFILLDDEPVEVRLDIARQEIENERLVALGWRRLFLSRSRSRVRLGVSRERDFIAEIRFHEFGELRFEFLRRWKWRVLRHRAGNLASRIRV